MTPGPMAPGGFVSAGSKVSAVVAGVEDAEDVLTALLPKAAVSWTTADDAGQKPWPVAEPDAVVVLARTPTDLRRLASLRAVLPEAKRFVVAITATPSWYDTPHVALARGIGQRWLRESHVTRWRTSGWLIAARFGKEVPAGDIVAAVVSGGTGFHLGSYPLPASSLGDPGLADWRPGDPDAAWGGEPEKSGIPSGELAIRRPGTEWPDERVPTFERISWRETSWAEVGRPGGYATLRAVTRATLDDLPPVDERSVNPRGFLRTPTQDIADLTARDGRWAVRSEGRELVTFDESGLVTDADVDRLRRLRGLRVTWRPAHTGPVAAARVVAGLAAAGVPLASAVPVPLWAESLLGAELLGHLARPADLADDLRREELSVRLRRHALRTHGTTARWRALAATAGLHIPPDPAISVVMSTRRADFVPFALAQIARQRAVDAEVVLALHGVPRAEVAAAVADFPLPLTVVEAGADTPFGEVLNRAVDHASGDHVSKWDDDDWYGPDHLSDLVLAHRYSGSDLVGVASEFFYLEQIDLTIRRRWTSEVMSDHVAGGTFLISRETLRALGGFRPVTRSVDVELFQALLHAGGSIYRTHGLGFMARRSARGRHTWQEPIGYFLHRAKDQWRGFRPTKIMEQA
ncbi:glycosyltransferase [Spongiactinospora sp. TRM90649]|uniref:glycosyltransferase family 2 protein n=1 Tax=Spongiactinospora sp. TRM90649 TaxID=3031114 RepID=UPI0023F9C594|nr:glycosyltransferase [Spongiactinospora sp. TRM90649]MDF5757477.1 glycosyltransferase [Spongiactinospora sp. TRM90649]